jgi:hypothetical protein
MDTIAPGESFHQIVLVLPYPFDEISSHTDIEGAISPACNNVDRGLLIQLCLPGFRLPVFTGTGFAGMTNGILLDT